MHRTSFTVAGAMAVAVLGTAGLAGAQPAGAAEAEADCSGYQHVYKGNLSEGEETQQPPRYFFDMEAGPMTFCLDGPEGADFNMKLIEPIDDQAHLVRAEGNAPGDDTMEYTPAEAPKIYWVALTAVQGSGEYTVGMSYE